MTPSGRDELIFDSIYDLKFSRSGSSGFFNDDSRCVAVTGAEDQKLEEAILWSAIEYGGVDYHSLILFPSFQEMHEGMMTALRVLPDIVEVNKMNRIITFLNGSRMHFGFLNSGMKYVGLEVNFIGYIRPEDMNISEILATTTSLRRKRDSNGIPINPAPLRLRFTTNNLRYSL